MAWTSEQLSAIYDRTSGYCHLCNRKLAWTNYAAHGCKGSWEVEHSVPRASGGTNRMNNLYAACIECNRRKQHHSTRSCRAENGRTKAPLGRSARRAAKRDNALAGAGLGALLGVPFGPIGIFAGSVFGACIGEKQSVD